MQVVATRAGMGVKHAKRLVLAVQGADELDQQDVLEHVSEVAGVESVAVAQHERKVCCSAHRAGAIRGSTHPTIARQPAPECAANASAPHGIGIFINKMIRLADV